MLGRPLSTKSIRRRSLSYGAAPRQARARPSARLTRDSCAAPLIDQPLLGRFDPRQFLEQAIRYVPHAWHS
jgi:hypothetical protein